MGVRQARGRKGELDVRHPKDSFALARLKRRTSLLQQSRQRPSEKSCTALPPRLSESTTHQPENTPLGLEGCSISTGSRSKRLGMSSAFSAAGTASRCGGGGVRYDPRRSQELSLALRRWTWTRRMFSRSGVLRKRSKRPFILSTARLGSREGHRSGRLCGPDAFGSRTRAVLPGLRTRSSTASSTGVAAPKAARALTKMPPLFNLVDGRNLATSSWRRFKNHARDSLVG